MSFSEEDVRCFCTQSTRITNLQNEIIQLKNSLDRKSTPEIQTVDMLLSGFSAQERKDLIASLTTEGFSVKVVGVVLKAEKFITQGAS